MRAYRQDHRLRSVASATACCTSPNAQIVAALLVRSMVFGPRRLLAATAVPLLRQWIGRALRGMVAR
jgi:hypothetical protein